MLVWFCVLRNFVHTHLMHPCIACPSRCIGYYNFCHHYNLFSIPRPALILAHLYTRKLHRDTSFKADLLTHKTADTLSRTCRNCFNKFTLPFISAVFLCLQYPHKRRCAISVHYGPAGAGVELAGVVSSGGRST